MPVFILFRHLFAPAYTETQYTPSGNPRTTTLKSEVSSGQYLSSRCPIPDPPLGSEEMLSGDSPSPEEIVSLTETQGVSRRHEI